MSVKRDDMDRKEKLKMLQKLKEDELKEYVLIPFFEKMKYKWVCDFQGDKSHRKHIICYKVEEPLQSEITKRFIGIFIFDNITGDLNGNGNASIVFGDIKKVASKYFFDEGDRTQWYVNDCFVISLEEIGSVAERNIKSSLKKEGVHGFISFIDGDKLVSLIDKSMPLFSAIEEIRSLSEEIFTQRIVKRLLGKMPGCRYVEYVHKKRGEFGVDVVFELDTIFGPFFCGAQIKTEKIHGNSTGDQNTHYSTVLTQATQALQIPHYHKAHNAEKMIDIFLVITSNEITEDARIGLSKALLKRMGKNMIFVDRTELVGWLVKYAPELVRGDSYG